VAAPVIALLLVLWRRSAKQISILEHEESEKKLKRKKIATLRARIVELEDENRQLRQ